MYKAMVEGDIAYPMISLSPLHDLKLSIYNRINPESKSINYRMPFRVNKSDSLYAEFIDSHTCYTNAYHIWRFHGCPYTMLSD